MSEDKFILHEWEKDKMEELVRYEEREEELKLGEEEGSKKKEIEIVREMLKNNIDIDTISKVTKKSVEEIEKLQKEDL